MGSSVGFSAASSPGVFVAMRVKDDCSLGSNFRIGLQGCGTTTMASATRLYGDNQINGEAHLLKKGGNFLRQGEVHMPHVTECVELSVGSVHILGRRAKNPSTFRWVSKRAREHLVWNSRNTLCRPRSRRAAPLTRGAKVRSPAQHGGIRRPCGNGGRKT